MGPQLCRTVREEPTNQQPLAVRSGCHAPWHLPKGAENSGPHENPHTGADGSFIVVKPQTHVTSFCG